ncbi:MAG: nucleoid-associated protein [Bacteroidales bacterium]|nr:nucleoid-associated protein [Bacteroidales bacterium]MBN2819207.1 nucleoid-associated protein [Bacteroidales bacterium]
MILTDSTNIDALAIHKVGNKGAEEGIRLSNSLIHPDDSISQLLITYFFSQFKTNEYFNLHHETDLQMNEVYNYVSTVFEDPDLLYDQSVNIAEHLYNQSLHPKVKSGELYVVYFQDCMVEGECVDAIGIFKSESRETYLKIYTNDNGFEIRSDDGISLKKLDKGCLIFNIEKENGYLVAIPDNLKKSSEARFWNDDFLRIIERTDSFFHTKNVINMCKSYVEERMPEDFQITRIDQADIMNKTAKFFKENDTFDMQDFSQEVMEQPELMNSFKAFSKHYERENKTALQDVFEISDNAVKKQSRVFKSVIKLDKNFHIYVHGKRDNIVKGYDEESRMHYYQIFFNEET